MSVDLVIGSPRGLVVAPAGCGKTHLITDTLRRKQQKPYLVLTHTTAGVAALKQRLKRLAVPTSNYVVSTIDGWAMRISQMFPSSCDIRSSIAVPRDYYPELRTKVNDYIRTGNLNDIIQASHSRLLVDEYQDCDLSQHKLISSISEILPTVVFGDPMQCIFNFGGPMPDWNQDVIGKFPIITELTIPWRWINSGTEALGEWILNCRNRLLNGQNVDLSNCPAHVTWHRLSNNPQENIGNQTKAHYAILNSCDECDSILVIGDSKNPRARHNFASSSRGIDVVEPVDLKDVTQLARQMDLLNGNDLATVILDKTSSMMTGIRPASLKNRISSILKGTNRTPATEVEHAVKSVIEIGDRQSIANLLCELEESSETRVFRWAAFAALKKAVSMSIDDTSSTILSSAELVREQRRHQGDTRIPSRAIGSTLLLKGLESEHTLILDAGVMTPENLYVALSRGSKSITVFSNTFEVPR